MQIRLSLKIQSKSILHCLTLKGLNSAAEYWSAAPEKAGAQPERRSEKAWFFVSYNLGGHNWGLIKSKTMKLFK